MYNISFLNSNGSSYIYLDIYLNSFYIFRSIPNQFFFLRGMKFSSPSQVFIKIYIRIAAYQLYKHGKNATRNIYIDKLHQIFYLAGYIFCYNIYVNLLDIFHYICSFNVRTITTFLNFIFSFSLNIKTSDRYPCYVIDS